VDCSSKKVGEDQEDIFYYEQFNNTQGNENVAPVNKLKSHTVYQFE